MIRMKIAQVVTILAAGTAVILSLWYEWAIMANTYDHYRRLGLGPAIIVWFLGELVWLMATVFYMGIAYAIARTAHRLLRVEFPF